DSGGPPSTTTRGLPVKHRDEMRVLSPRITRIYADKEMKGISCFRLAGSPCSQGKPNYPHGIAACRLKFLSRRCRADTRRGMNPRCWARSRCLLHFKRADVDPAISYAIKAWSALVVVGRGNEIRIAGINGRASW